MLNNVWSVLSTESTQHVSNFTSFFKLLHKFHFLKGASIISLNFSSYYHSSAYYKYIGKATTFTFYAISQHKM